MNQTRLSQLAQLIADQATPEPAGYLVPYLLVTHLRDLVHDHRAGQHEKTHG